MDEQEGIKAVIYLQSLAGIEESEEDAKAGWNSMTGSEKRRTMEIYAMLKRPTADAEPAGQ